MSVSFTHYNVANKTSLFDAGIHLSEGLLALGFSPVSTVHAVVYDADDREFLDQEDLGVTFIKFIGDSALYSDIYKSGYMVSFMNDVGVTLQFRLANNNSSTVCILDMSDKEFYGFFKSPYFDKFVEIISLSGESISAMAGFGAMECEWNYYSLDEVVDFISSGPPDYEGMPPPTALIRREYVKNYSGLEVQMLENFNFFDRRSNTVLLRKGAEELYSSLT